MGLTFVFIRGCQAVSQDLVQLLAFLSPFRRLAGRRAAKKSVEFLASNRFPRGLFLLASVASVLTAPT